jgi:hypothetical protein
MGSGGPNAAGLAAKVVPLSSVKLMAALGGNRAKGVFRLKKPDTNDWGGDPVLATSLSVVERDRAVAIDPIERDNKNKEEARKKAMIAILGGRIAGGVCLWCRFLF